ncbi:MAG: ATP-binding protein, partial [Cyanobacteria bacterium P01_F01_bin.153]
AIVCALYISRAITRPIRRLTDQTQQITQEENFKLRVSVDTEDETSQLAYSIDQLVSWAGQYTTELERAQTTLEQQFKELRLAQAQMVQSEKMSSLGQMVAGVAHEINNPVGFIYSNISYASGYVKDLLSLIHAYQGACPEQWQTEEISEIIEDIDLDFLEEDVTKVLRSMEVGADRIKEIVLSLRTFSRLDESGVKLASLQDGIDSTLTILSHRLKASHAQKSIEVVRDYGDLPPVNCNAGQINQVFMNLLANAIDALEEGPDGDVKSAAAMPSESSPSPSGAQIVVTTRVDGDRQVVTVSDNGPGISPDVRDRIFDPFFTTKPTGQGTGMGLAISHQIVEQHGGRLYCQSKVGRGTIFIMEIPTALPQTSGGFDAVCINGTYTDAPLNATESAIASDQKIHG